MPEKVCLIGAAAALAESEQRFRSLVEAHAQAVWETNPAGEAVVDSPTWRAFTGQTFEAWSGYGWLDAIHPDDRVSAEQQWREAVRARRSVDTEFRLRDAQGGYRWTNARAAPIFAPDGSVRKWSGMNIDITERKEAEQLLRSSAWKQDFLLRLADILRAISDPQEILEEASKQLGEYLNADRAGYAEAQPDGQTIMVGVHYAGNTSRIEGIYRYSDYGEGLLEEFLAGRTVVRSDVANDPLLSDRVKAAHAAMALGATANKPLRDGNKLLAVFFVHFRKAHHFPSAELELIEETAERTWAAVERARAEIALRESEKRYRTLFESIDEGFCLIEVLFDDGAPVDYRFLEANPAFEMQTGLTDVVGRTVRELVPALDSHWFEIYGQIALSGEPQRFAQASEALGRYYDVYAFRVGKPDERRVAVLFNDISDRKKAEDVMAADLHDTQLLRALGARFPSPAETKTLYGEISEAAILLARADAGTMQIYDEVRENLVLITAQGLPLEVWQRCATQPAGSGTSCGLAMASGKRAFVDFEEAQPDPHGDLAWHRNAGFCSAQSTPLVSRSGRPIGMLSTHWRKPHRPSEREMRYFDLLARQAADLIEQRETEQRIRESEEQFRKAVHDAPIPVMMFAEDGQVLQLSRTWTELTGYTPEDMRDFDAWMDMAYGPGAQVLRVHIQKLFQSHARTVNVELEVRTQNQERRRWAFSASAPGALLDGRRFVVGMALDITERRQVEDALRESQERLRLIVENARDYAIVSMDLKRNVTSWNSGAEHLLGYAQQEILGGTADVIFTSEDRRAQVPESEAQTAIDAGRASDERWHLRKNGTPFWGSGVMMAMHDATGQTVGLVKIFRDVTETRAAQKALEESKADLVEALRENESARREVEAASRAKDHFLAVLSHELRTPLSPVLMTTMTLQRRADLPPPVAKGLEMIRRNVLLECHLIDDLLDLTRIARGKLEIAREPVDLHEVIRNAVEISRPDIDAKKQHLEVELGADRTALIGDATRLPQLIWNLLKNASKFTPANGWIRLATRRRGERIVVKVSDSGAGIRADRLAIIFDAFIQAEESTFTEYGGLGLGLAIAKATVEAHGGVIEATSAGLGRGSTFFFELPLVPEDVIS